MYKFGIIHNEPYHKCHINFKIKGVNQASSKSSELLGNLVEGTVDAAVDTITSVANGVVTVGKKGIDTAGAILDGDTEKAIECGKDLAKIAAVSALSIGVIDVIDGLDILDGADQMAISDGIDMDNTVDADRIK